jgi:hypothetical protein
VKRKWCGTPREHDQLRAEEGDPVSGEEEGKVENNDTRAERRESHTARSRVETAILW